MMMMMSFEDSIPNYGLKNKAISNTKIKPILSSMVSSDVRIYLRDEQSKTAL